LPKIKAVLALLANVAVGRHWALLDLVEKL
jgi:hypothetical protein